MRALFHALTSVKRITRARRIFLLKSQKVQKISSGGNFNIKCFPKMLAAMAFLLWAGFQIPTLHLHSFYHYLNNITIKFIIVNAIIKINIAIC